MRKSTTKSELECATWIRYRSNLIVIISGKKIMFNLRDISWQTLCGKVYFFSDWGMIAPLIIS